MSDLDRDARLVSIREIVHTLDRLYIIANLQHLQNFGNFLLGATLLLFAAWTQLPLFFSGH